MLDLCSHIFNSYRDDSISGRRLGYFRLFIPLISNINCHNAADRGPQPSIFDYATSKFGHANHDCESLSFCNYGGSVRYTLAIFCLIAMAGICSSTVRAQSRTFYIDAATGSNSNFGTQASPWKSAPGMQNNTTCSNNIVQHQSAGVNYSHQAGDHFLFKGGVTWPVACFQITITVGGASGNPDYWGVCVSNADLAAETNLPHGATNGSPCATGTSWPSAGWTRPKFDMAGSVPTGNNVIIVGSSFAGNVTFDNLEIANQGITITNTGVGSAYDFITVSG